MKHAKSTTAAKSTNRGPRRRAMLVLFRHGFGPGEIARVFKVKVADVWGELRKAVA